MIIHAGDIVDYNPWPSEVLERIIELNVLTVMGNHDRDSATGEPQGYNPYAEVSCLWTHNQLNYEEKKHLAELPKKLELEIEGVKLFVCHGSPFNMLDEYVFPPPATSTEELTSFFGITKSDIIIMGHTHVPFVERLDDKIVLNPGGVGQPRDNISSASYMIMKLDQKKIEINHKRAGYDVEKVVEEIARKGLPPFLGHRLFHGI